MEARRHFRWIRTAEMAQLTVEITDAAGPPLLSDFGQPSSAPAVVAYAWRKAECFPRQRLICRVRRVGCRYAGPFSREI